MTAERGDASNLLRVCLDLNVWVADFLGTLRLGKRGSSSWLINAVRSGATPAGPIQLVISLSMIDRLKTVFIRDFGVPVAVADALTRAIGNLSAFGPAGDFPHIVLGGAVYPIRDEEDRTVLQVAVAGRADLLVTANLRDFAMAGIELIGDGSRIRLYSPPGRHPLVITHPDVACTWLRAGLLPHEEVARSTL